MALTARRVVCGRCSRVHAWGTVSATRSTSCPANSWPSRPRSARPCAVQQGVELGAQGLADRGRQRKGVRVFAGQLVDRVAETVPQACTREQRPQTTRRTVKAIGQDAADAIQRLLL